MDMVPSDTSEPPHGAPAQPSEAAPQDRTAHQGEDDLSAGARWSDDPQHGRVGEVTVAVEGITCAACTHVIARALAPVDGLLSVQVQAATQKATLRWADAQLRWPQVQERLSSAGYRFSPVVPAQASEARRRERRNLLWQLFVAWFCAMQIMMLATPAYVSEPQDIPADLQVLLHWGQWVLCLPVLLLASGPFFAKAWRSLRMRTLSMEVPVALGLAVMFIAGTASTFDPHGPWGPEVWFDSLSMFVSFLLTARWFDMKARHRAAEEVEALHGLDHRPVRRRSSTGQVEWVAADALRPGDHVWVAVGERLPADGALLTASTEVTESLLTGESLPVLRHRGEGLLAGGLNVGSPLEMEVHAAGAGTRRRQLLALAEEAAAQRPALIQAADRWAGPFLVAVVVAAAMGAGVWWWIDPTRALGVAVAVLVVTCPCALSLAAPTAILSTARALARRGVVVQRLAALESAARIDTVVFDKTGTLTHDQLRVLSTEASPQALSQAASLALLSRHPAALAVLALAQERGIEPQTAWAWQGVKEWPGCGVEGTDAQGQLWRLGKPQWVAGQFAAPSVPSAALPPSDSSTSEPHHASLAWGSPGEGVTEFVLSDQLRSDAVHTVRQLSAQGAQSWLLSGDAQARVERMARDAGVSVLGAGVGPAEKLAAVQRLQAQGRKVAMVGDGVNDAPVLAVAQHSFALGHGSAEAVARADFVITDGRLASIPWVMAESRRCWAVLKQNLWWSVLYNLLSVPLALLGLLPPWLAGLGMALSSLVVVFNSQRLARELP